MVGGLHINLAVFCIVSHVRAWEASCRKIGMVEDPPSAIPHNPQMGASGQL